MIVFFLVTIAFCLVLTSTYLHVIVSVVSAKYKERFIACIPFLSQ